MDLWDGAVNFVANSCKIRTKVYPLKYNLVTIMTLEVHKIFYSSSYICFRKVLCLVLAKKSVQDKKYGLDICEARHDTPYAFYHHATKRLLKLHEGFMQQRYMYP